MYKFIFGLNLLFDSDKKIKTRNPLLSLSLSGFFNVELKEDPLNNEFSGTGRAIRETRNARRVKLNGRDLLYISRMAELVSNGSICAIIKYVSADSFSVFSGLLDRYTQFLSSSIIERKEERKARVRDGAR